MSCYNMNRQQPRINDLWYQCMMCYASNHTEKKYLDIPSSSVCKSDLCKLEFAVMYSNNEKQLKENLEEMNK